MESKSKKITFFTDLYTWQEGHKLVLEIYKITKSFPKEELFGITNQLRRAGVSFTSNIAEGFSRTSYKEKTQFYAMALGSLTEIQNQLIVTKDIGYISEKAYSSLFQQTIIIHKLANGLIKKSKSLIRNS